MNFQIIRVCAACHSAITICKLIWTFTICICPKHTSFHGLHHGAVLFMLQAEDCNGRGNANEKEKEKMMKNWSDDTIKDKSSKLICSPLVIPGGPKTSLYSSSELDEPTEESQELLGGPSSRLLQTEIIDIQMNCEELCKETGISDHEIETEIILLTSDKNKMSECSAEDAALIMSDIADSKLITSEPDTAKEAKLGKESKSLSDASSVDYALIKPEKFKTACEKEKNRLSLLSVDSDSCLDWTDEEVVLDNLDEKITFTSNDELSDIGEDKKYLVLDSVGGSDSDSVDDVKAEIHSTKEGANSGSTENKTQRGEIPHTLTVQLTENEQANLVMNSAAVTYLDDTFTNVRNSSTIDTEENVLKLIEDSKTSILSAVDSFKDTELTDWKDELAVTVGNVPQAVIEVEVADTEETTDTCISEPNEQTLLVCETNQYLIADSEKGECHSEVICNETGDNAGFGSLEITDKKNKGLNYMVGDGAVNSEKVVAAAHEEDQSGCLAVVGIVASGLDSPLPDENTDPDDKFGPSSLHFGEKEDDTVQHVAYKKGTVHLVESTLKHENITSDKNTFSKSYGETPAYKQKQKNYCDRDSVSQTSEFAELKEFEMAEDHFSSVSVDTLVGCDDAIGQPDTCNTLMDLSNFCYNQLPLPVPSGANNSQVSDNSDCSMDIVIGSSGFDADNTDDVDILTQASRDSKQSLIESKGKYNKAFTAVRTDSTRSLNEIKVKRDDFKAPQFRVQQDRTQGVKNIGNSGSRTLEMNTARTIAAVAPIPAASQADLNTDIGEPCQIMSPDSQDLSNTLLPSLSQQQICIQSPYLSSSFLSPGSAFLGQPQAYRFINETPFRPQYHPMDWHNVNGFPGLDSWRWRGFTPQTLAAYMLPHLQNYQLPYSGSDLQQTQQYSFSPGQLHPWIFSFQYPPNISPYQPNTFFSFIYNTAFTFLNSSCLPDLGICSKGFRSHNLDIGLIRNSNLPSLKELCSKNVEKNKMSKAVKDREKEEVIEKEPNQVTEQYHSDSFLLNLGTNSSAVKSSIKLNVVTEASGCHCSQVNYSTDASSNLSCSSTDSLWNVKEKGKLQENVFDNVVDSNRKPSSEKNATNKFKKDVTNVRSEVNGEDAENKIPYGTAVPDGEHGIRESNDKGGVEYSLDACPSADAPDDTRKTLRSEGMDRKNDLSGDGVNDLLHITSKSIQVDSSEILGTATSASSVSEHCNTTEETGTKIPEMSDSSATKESCNNKYMYMSTPVSFPSLFNTEENIDSEIQDFYQEVKPFILDAEIKDCWNTLESKRKELQNKAVRRNFDLQPSRSAHKDNYHHMKKADFDYRQSNGELNCTSQKAKLNRRLLTAEKEFRELELNCSLKDEQETVGKLDSHEKATDDHLNPGEDKSQQTNILYEKKTSTIQALKMRIENNITSSLFCDEKNTLILGENKVSHVGQIKTHVFSKEDYKNGRGENLMTNSSSSDLLEEDFKSKVDLGGEELVVLRNAEDYNCKKGIEEFYQTVNSIFPGTEVQDMQIALSIRKKEINDRADHIRVKEEAKTNFTTTEIIKTYSHEDINTQTEEDKTYQKTDVVNANKVTNSETSADIEMQMDMDQLQFDSEFHRKETEMVQQSSEVESPKERDTKIVQQFDQPNDIPLDQIERENDNYVSVGDRTILHASSQSESLLLCEEGEISTSKNEEIHCKPQTDCYIWNGQVIPLGKTADMKQTVEKKLTSEQLHSNESVNNNSGDNANNQMEQVTQSVKPVKQSNKQVVKKAPPSKNCGTSKPPKMSCISAKHSAANCLKSNVLDKIDDAGENTSSNSLAQKANKPFRKKAKKKRTRIDKAVDCFYKEINNMQSHIEVLPPSKSKKPCAPTVRAIVSCVDNDGDKDESSERPNFVLSSVERIVDYDDDECDENSVDVSNLRRKLKNTSMSDVKVCSLAVTGECPASRVNEHKNPSAENNTVYEIASSSTSESFASSVTHSAMFSPKEIDKFTLKNDQQKALTETHLDEKDSSNLLNGSTDRPDSADISESDHQLLSNVSQGQKQNCITDFSKRYSLHETVESGNRLLLMDKYLDTVKYSDSHVTTSASDVNKKNENPITLPVSVSYEKNYESCELLIKPVDYLKSIEDTLGSLSAVQNYLNEDSNSSCASIKEEEGTVFEKNCNNTSLSENASNFANKINDVSSDTEKKTTVQINKALSSMFPEVQLNTSENKKTVECSSIISIKDCSVMDTKVLLESHSHLSAMTRCLDNGSESLGIKNSSAVECASSSYSSVNSRNYKACFRTNTRDGQESDEQNKTVGVYSTADDPSVLTVENVMSQANSGCYLDGSKDNDQSMKNSQGLHCFETVENVTSQANSGCYLDGSKDNDQSMKNSQDLLHCFETGMHNNSLAYEDPSGFTDVDLNSTDTALTSGPENASSMTQQSSFRVRSSAYDESSDECCKLSVNIGQGKNTHSDAIVLQDSLAALKGYLSDNSSSSDSDLEEGVNTDIESSSKKMLSDASFDITKNKNNSLTESAVNLIDSCNTGMMSSYLKCKWIEEDIVSPDNSDTESIHDTSCSHDTVKAVSDCEELYTSEVVEHLQPPLRYSEGRNSDVNTDAKSSYSISKKGKQPSAGIIDQSEFSDSSIVLDCSLNDSPVSNISKLSLSKLEERKKRLTRILMKRDSESSLKPEYVYSELNDSKYNPDVSQKLADIRYWIQQAEEESIIVRKRLYDKLQQGWDSPCSEDEDSDVPQLQVKEFLIQDSLSNSNEDLKLLNELTDSSSVKSSSSLQHAETRIKNDLKSSHITVKNNTELLHLKPHYKRQGIYSSKSSTSEDAYNDNQTISSSPLSQGYSYFQNRANTQQFETQQFVSKIDLQNNFVTDDLERHSEKSASISRHKTPDCTEEMDRLTRPEQVTQSLRQRSRSGSRTSNSDSRNEIFLSVIDRTWKKDQQRSSSNETQSTWCSSRARSRLRELGKFNRSKSKDTWSSVSSDRNRAVSNCSYSSSRESSQSRHYKQSKRRTRKRSRSGTNSHQERASRRSSSSRKRSRSNSNRKRLWSEHSDRSRTRQSSGSRGDRHKVLSKTTDEWSIRSSRRSRSKSTDSESLGFEKSKNEAFISNPRRDKTINMDVRQCSTREKVIILHSAALACETFGMYRPVGFWQTTQTQMRCCKRWHMIRVSNVFKYFSHFWLAWTQSRKSYCTTPGVRVSVHIYVKVF